MPVFLLILLGFALKQSLMRLETQWHGLERLVYYVLLPALLIDTLTRADLATVPVLGVGGALMLSALLLSLLCLARRPLLAAKCAIDGPAFTSIFQGATRWQTYVALAVAGNLYGDLGLALASVAMVAIIPLVNVLSTNLAVGVCCTVVPTSSSGYVLARQMGGDAPCWRKSSRCRPFSRPSPRPLLPRCNWALKLQAYHKQEEDVDG